MLFHLKFMQLAAVDPYTAVILRKKENFEHLIMNFNVFSPSRMEKKMKARNRKPMFGSQFVCEPHKLKLTHITFI